MAILFTWGRRAAARRAGGVLCRPAGGRRSWLLRGSGRPPAPRRQGGALERAAAGAFPAPAFASPGWPHERPGGALRAPSPPLPPRGGGALRALSRAQRPARELRRASRRAVWGRPPPARARYSKGGDGLDPSPPAPLPCAGKGEPVPCGTAVRYYRGGIGVGGHPEQSLLSLRVLAAA